MERCCWRLECLRCECAADERRFGVCGRCRTAVYCSVACQRADWKRHKPLCQPQPPSTTTIAPIGQRVREKTTTAAPARPAPIGRQLVRELQADAGQRTLELEAAAAKLRCERVTEQDAHRPLVEAVRDALQSTSAEWVPTVVCSIVAEYGAYRCPRWTERTWNERIRSRRSVRDDPIEGLGSIGRDELKDLLRRDLVAEIQLVQDCNQGGAYYRVHTKMRTSCRYWKRDGWIERGADPDKVYQMWDGGSPRSGWRPGRWMIPMGGPSLEDMPNNSVYRVSDHSSATPAEAAEQVFPSVPVYFDAQRRGDFMIRFVRRD